VEVCTLERRFGVKIVGCLGGEEGGRKELGGQGKILKVVPLFVVFFVYFVEGRKCCRVGTETMTSRYRFILNYGNSRDSEVRRHFLIKPKEKGQSFFA